MVILSAGHLVRLLFFIKRSMLVINRRDHKIEFSNMRSISESKSTLIPRQSKRFVKKSFIINFTIVSIGNKFRSGLRSYEPITHTQEVVTRPGVGYCRQWTTWSGSATGINMILSRMSKLWLIYWALGASTSWVFSHIA